MASLSEVQACCVRRGCPAITLDKVLSKIEVYPSLLQNILLQKDWEVVTQGSTRRPSISVPRFQTCSIDGCLSASVRDRSCPQCKKHLCNVHLSGKFHKCQSNFELPDGEWERAINDEVAALFSGLNVEELVKLGSSLNKGIACTLEKGKHIGVGAIMGCKNYHAWLNFVNGDRWLVRIPRMSFSDIPTDLMDYVVTSEYATLKFLERVNIPTPKVFAYGLASDPANRVGVSFILMQVLRGRSLELFDASPKEKNHVFKQYASILSNLYYFPMPLAGSLTMAKNKITKRDELTLGAIASNRFIVLNPHGPFKSPVDYITSTIEQYLDLIADGQLHPEIAVEAFVFYHFLRENISIITQANPSAPNRFFLKHVNDMGDHILVDEDYNITGIVDWQFARFVPAAEAFGPSYFTADPTTLYTSNTHLTTNDRLLAQYLSDGGYPDLAFIAKNNEIMRRFHNGLTCGSFKTEAHELLKGMVACVLGKAVTNIETWIEAQIEKCRNDPRWDSVVTLLGMEMRHYNGSASD